MEKDVELKKLGLRIKELRKVKNITQGELAHAIDKDQQSIQRLEAGKVNPSFIYLKQIAKGLDISLSEIFDIP